MCTCLKGVKATQGSTPCALPCTLNHASGMQHDNHVGAEKTRAHQTLLQQGHVHRCAVDHDKATLADYAAAAAGCAGRCRGRRCRGDDHAGVLKVTAEQGRAGGMRGAAQRDAGAQQQLQRREPGCSGGGGLARTRRPSLMRAACCCDGSRVGARGVAGMASQQGCRGWRGKGAVQPQAGTGPPALHMRAACTVVGGTPGLLGRERRWLDT